MSGVTRREVAQKIVQSGGISVFIKATNAALAYVMLLAIAHSATPEQYGIFAVAFSIATTVGTIALFAQPTTVNRFWPQWMGQNEPLKARAALRLGMMTAAFGVSAAVIFILLGGVLNLIVEMPWSLSVAAPTALFAFAFGWAAFVSAGLRAQGFVVRALAPQDIAWRIAVCVIFGGVALAGGLLDAETILLIVGSLLVLIIAPQTIMLHRSCKGTKIEYLHTTERRILFRYSGVIWAIESIQWLKDYAGVVIVSAYLGAEAAGGYFTAFRTAFLLGFFLMSLNLVISPLISRYFHSDRKDLVRVIVGMTGLIASSAALIGIIFFFFFGAEILALFNPLYATHLPILLILSSARIFAAVAGPAATLLNMSGHQLINLILTGSIGIFNIALQTLGGLYFGVVGVAVGVTIGTVVGALALHQCAWRTLGLDCSGISLAARALWRFLEATVRFLRLPH